MPRRRLPSVGRLLLLAALFGSSSCLRIGAGRSAPSQSHHSKPNAIATVAAQGRDFLVRSAAAAVLCCSLAGPPQCVFARDVLVPDASSAGSPVAAETIGLVDKYYLDRSFNGFDLKRAQKELEGKTLSEDQALDESARIVKSLGDRYSRVLTPKQAEKLGKYDVTGVGINLVIANDGTVQIGAVPPAESDAAKLGVAFGDVITSINGRNPQGMTSFDALEAIQSDGEYVSLKLRPSTGGSEREVSLRKMFQTKNPVSYKMVTSDDGTKIGYIKLSEFNAQCKKRVREALARGRDDGIERLVLDMRGNGGGVLDGALGIAGFFMPKPLVLYVTDANGAMQPLYSRESLLAKDLPLQVWVDQNTASSAEVLAAALHDQCRASVVGGVTYGKGLIQGVFGLSDGGALIETVASYSTPARLEINKRGVIPDEKRTFLSDALGGGFLEADIKGASFKSLRQCRAPTPEAGSSAATTQLAGGGAE